MNVADQNVLPSGFPLREVRKAVLRWYGKHARTLPWRNNGNPYHVLVSEIMLQQTQVSRVLEKFPIWLRKFPDIKALAQAPRRSILTAWSGMGYNRRVLNLHEAAKVITSQYNGTIPEDPAVLQSLPGFGRYTAAAVACFGFHRRVPLVDINVRRVVSRLIAKRQYEHDLITEKDAWGLAAAFLPPRAFYNWNQALMDLGALVCTAANPQCTVCPIQRYCPSAGQMTQRPKTTKGIVRDTPRRIYRGKVIELLRSENGRAVRSFNEIGVHLKSGFTQEDHEWLANILHTLQSDGMVEVQVRGKSVSLARYDGSFIGLKIRLAQ